MHLRVCAMTLAAISLVAGCNTSSSNAGGGIDLGFSYVPPPLPSPNEWSALPFPKTDGGGVIISEVPGAKLVIDASRRTPISALADCSRGLLGCVEAGHTLDECVWAVPDCKTARPWEEPALCCPAACAKEYQAARGQGMTTNAALKATYFKSAGCFPGLQGNG